MRQPLQYILHLIFLPIAIYGTGLPKLGQGIWQQLVQMHRHLLQQHGGQLPNMCKLFIQDVTELGCISLQEPEFEFNI